MDRSHDCPAATLAEYVGSIRFEKIPPEIVDWAIALIEDNLGCALGALALPESRLILATAEAAADGAGVQVIGGGPSSVTSAVFCNSQLSNLLDFDDTYDYFMPYHPGSMIIPSALAVAEAIGASGSQLLTSIVAAYEVVLRVGRGVGNVLWGGLPSTMAIDELGPAVAAAKLYELDVARVRALFSIIAMDEVRSPQLRPRGQLISYPRIGSLKGNFGSRAQAAVLAAQKARAGFEGSSGMLEWSLAEWSRVGLPARDYESLVTDCDGHLITKMSLKPIPACRTAHPPVTAALSALGDRHLDSAEIARIRVIGVPRLQATQWATMIDAQFSVPCALALALGGIEPGPKWYSDGAFKSQRIMQLASKVEQVFDTEAERVEILEGRFACRVEIELENGRTLEGDCRAIKGEPANPLCDSERRRKYLANTGHLPEMGRSVALAIQNLSRAQSVKELTMALGGD